MNNGKSCRMFLLSFLLVFLFVAPVKIFAREYEHKPNIELNDASRDSNNSYQSLVEPEINTHWFNYVPLVVTAPASIIFTGTGYIFDGAIFVTGLIVVPVVICTPIILPIVVISRDGRLGGELFRACAEGVNQNVDTSLYETGVGNGIYRSTKSWRKPMHLIGDYQVNGVSIEKAKIQKNSDLEHPAESQESRERN